jgi:CBS domain-containing protein
MTKGAECVRPSRSLQEAAQMMPNLDVGPLPICGDDDQRVGMITDRDITVRAVAQGGLPLILRAILADANVQTSTC